MKHMIKLPAIVLGLMLLLTGITQKVMAQGEDVSMQSFYDELSPYGTWIQDSQYGYVWRPDVGQGDFRPYYSNGRWAMTEYGNTWVSDYDWGWAPFHYGRWVYNRYSQWVWIPDTKWGPAWVSWRSGGGYYGWAPMGPGMNVNINIGIPDLWWVFVPQRNIYYNSFPRYYSRRNLVIINNTTIINNTYVRNNRYYSSGPRANDIRQYTGRDVPVYSVNRTARPSRSTFDGNRINMYSPSRSRSGNTNVVGPRESVKGEGYATARPDRSTQDGRQGNNYDRPSRSNDVASSRASIDNRSDRNTQQAAPQRDQQQRAEIATSTRPDRVGRQDQAQPQIRQEQNQRPILTERQSQPERQAQPDRQPRQEQAPPARQEQPRQEQPRQEQPQRMERRPEVQQQAPQRIERSEPSRSSGNEGRGSSSAGRPSRSGRG
ncbi:hypothetical protein ACVWYN_000272 [Pedobacter sp. UYP24]